MRNSGGGGVDSCKKLNNACALSVSGGLGMAQDERLKLLKAARLASGLPLDFWADLTEGLDYSSLAILCGRSAMFPKYMNSRETPYVARKRLAAVRDKSRTPFSKGP